MKKLNNKGFAASVVLYGASTIIILVLLLILSILSTGEKNVSNMADTIKMEASGVKGTTYQLRNMITNGGFENGATGWRTTMIATTDGLENEVVSNVSKSGTKSIHIYPRGWQVQKLSGAISTGDKLYLGASIYQKASTYNGIHCSLGVNRDKGTGSWYGQFISPLEGRITFTTITDDFIRFGLIVAGGDDTDIFTQIGADSSSTSDGYIDDIVVINLTKTFGAGNEPDLAWCNANIEYFEGTTSITVYENE